MPWLSRTVSNAGTNKQIGLRKKKKAFIDSSSLKCKSLLASGMAKYRTLSEIKTVPTTDLFCYFPLCLALYSTQASYAGKEKLRHISP